MYLKLKLERGTYTKAIQVTVAQKAYEPPSFFLQNFLEDYGMIWVGTNDSSDDEDGIENDDLNDEEDDEEPLWNPGIFQSLLYQCH